MSYRKRLRKRGYVLMSVNRADSIIDLKKQLGVRHQQLGLAIEQNSRNWDSRKELRAEMETEKFGVSVDLLKAKHKLALERIAELENADE